MARAECGSGVRLLNNAAEFPLSLRGSTCGDGTVVTLRSGPEGTGGCCLSAPVPSPSQGTDR